MNRMINSDRLFAALLFAFAVMWWPLGSSAATTNVYISEVAWAGSSKSQADEWIELTNPTDGSIDISGWTIAGAGSSGSSLTLPEGSRISPYSTFLITNYAADHASTTLAQSPDYSTTAISLSNSSLALVLSDAAGVVVDQAGNGGKPAAGGLGENGGGISMIRAGNDAWRVADTSVGFDDGALELGTPGSLDALAEESAPATEPASSSTSGVTAPIYYPPGTLVISDWLADPSEGENEWVEINNPYNNVIPLEGWRVKEAGGRIVGLPDQLLGWEQSVRVNFSGSALNNSGDTIELLDPSGAVIHTVTYEPETEPVAQPEPTQEPTPVAAQESEAVVSATSAETTGQTSFAGLRLSELYPNTDGKDAEQEFIEIENAGTQSIDLFGIRLEDASGKSWSVAVHQSIAPGAYLTLPRTDFKFALNNSGQESVSLFAGDGTLLDATSYENAPEGFTFSRFETAWNWTATPTPNQSNILSESVASPSEDAPSVGGVAESEFAPGVSVEEARSAPIGSDVSVVGVVTAAPDTLGSQVMYLSGSGIQVYKHDGQWPELKVGDVVQASGSISSNRGEARIKVSGNEALAVLESGKDASAIFVTSLSEKYEGMLVTIQGRLLKSAHDRLRLEGSEGEIDVRLKDGAGIDSSLYAAGDLLEVTGIVRQVDASYQLLPRSSDDIRVLNTTMAGLTTTGKEEQQAASAGRGWILTLGTLILLTAFYVRHRRRNRAARGSKTSGLPEPVPAGV